MMKTGFLKTTIFLGMMLFVMMGTVFAYGSKKESDFVGFTDFDQIEEEYLSTIECLNWPNSTKLPEQLEGEDTEASFEVGYGDTRASNLWESAWIKEWLDTRNADSERADKALKELEKAFGMPYMGEDRCDDATRNYLRKIIDQAKSGNSSGFEEYMKVNG